MAVYRKKLVDKDGNTIIPAIGDIYGPVYTASLQSASGGIATYTFTPDTPVEANRVYAVKFPDPSVNNAVILLGDGNITASSILLPPVAASDSPSYELAYTYNINDTEPLLLMYNGSNQWVCLNQKKSVSSGDIDWSSLGYHHDTSATQITVNTSATTLLSFQLTAGTWLLIGTSDFNHNNTAIGDAYVGFWNLTTNNSIGNMFYFNEINNGTYWSVETANEVVTLTSTANIGFVAKRGQGTLIANRKSFTAIRIG